MPPTPTTTLPVVPPEGTATVMLVLLQLVAVPASVPLNLTVLEPWDAPKAVPVIVTESPEWRPVLGDTLVIPGRTVKVWLLEAAPLTVTITVLLPAARPAGVAITIEALLQLLTVAVVPPTVTVLLP